jgi:hypothetical protein
MPMLTSFLEFCPVWKLYKLGELEIIRLIPRLTSKSLWEFILLSFEPLGPLKMLMNLGNV